MPTLTPVPSSPLPSSPVPSHIDERIDPSLIPAKTLATGSKIPLVGLGTFGSDHVSHEAVAEAVQFAARIGYRHFDCAAVYGNEDRIGRIFTELLQGQLRRERDLRDLYGMALRPCTDCLFGFVEQNQPGQGPECHSGRFG